MAERDAGGQFTDGAQVLAECQARLRALCEQSADGIFVSDAQGNYQDVNAAGCRMLGYTREELVRLNTADVVAADEVSRVERETQEVRAGEVQRGEWVFRRKDGSVFPGEVRATRLPGGRLQAILRDVTERHATEEQQQVVMRHARCIMSAGLVQGGADWRERAVTLDSGPFWWGEVRVLNVAAAQEVLPLDLAPGQTYFQAWGASRSPADRLRAANTAARAFRQGDSMYRNEWRCVDKHGHEHWQHQVVTVRPAGERCWQVFGIATDVTDLKRAELEVRARAEEFRLITHHARCVLLHGVVAAPAGWRERLAAGEAVPFDWEGVKVLDQDAAQEVLPLVLAPGQTWLGAWNASRHPADREAAHERARAAFARGEGTFRNEFRCTDREGREHWLLEVVSVHALDEDHWHAFSVTTDVTELKQAEVAMRAASEQLRLVTRHARCILNGGTVAAPADWREQVGRKDHLPFDGSRLEVLNEEAADEVLPLAPQPGESWQRAWALSWREEDRRRADVTMARALLDGDPIYRNDYRCTDRFGQEHWLQQVVTVQPLDERHWRLFGIAIDITDLKAFETQMQLVTRHARCILSTGVVWAEPDWRLRATESACEDHPLHWDQVTVLNVEAAQEVLPLVLNRDGSYEQAWFRSRDPEHSRRADLTAGRALLAGDPTYRNEYRCTDRHGQERWLEQVVTVQPLDDCHWRVFGIAIDVTERHRAEDELRAVLTNARCILWHGEASELEGWVDESGRARRGRHWELRVEDERAAQQVVALDVPAGVSYADAWLDSRLAEDRERMAVNDLAFHALRTGAPGYSQEYRHRDKDGRVIWLHEDATITPLGPDRWRLVGVVTDITARRQAEEELRTVLTNARCILWHAEVEGAEGWEDDPENRGPKLHWAIRVQDLHAAQQVVALHVDEGADYMSALMGSRTEHVRRRLNYNAHRAFLHGAGGYEQEYSVHDRTGTEVWLREQTTIQPLGPARWRVVGVATDITALKAAEAEMEEVAREARCILNAGEVEAIMRDGSPLDLARAAFRFQIRVRNEETAQEVLPLDIPAGEEYQSVWYLSRHPEDRRQMSATAAEAFRTGAPFYRQEFRCTDRHGREHWLQQHVTVRPAGVGRWLVSGIATDVTELKQAAHDLLHVERQLQQAQRLESLGVLAGGIAHDFNNLLMAMLGNAELAQPHLTPGTPLARYLDGIKTAAHRAADLCRQMLTYSGKGRFVNEAVDLHELVEEMTHLLKTVVSKKAALRLLAPRRLPPVHGDASQLRQVVMNLVVNASEALGDRDGLITIAIETFECSGEYLAATHPADDLAPGAYVRLQVSDTGCGMDAETVQRIFDPFFTTKFTGRGLGLAAVLGIVKAHGGALGVYSEPGCGTTFKVLLPVATDTTEPPGAAAAPEPATWRGGGTVLVVDDEETVRDATQQLLRHLGFAVLTAEDGRTALDVYARHADEIVLVLLDLTMPRMSGEDAYRELRAVNPAVRVVLASGYSETDLAERFAGRGLAGVLQKPYTLATLREVLARVLPPA